MGSSISRRHDATGDGSLTSQPTMEYADSDVKHIYVSKDDLARWRPPPSRSGTPPPLSKVPPTPSLPTPNRAEPSSLTDRMAWTREGGKPGSSTDNAIEISDGDSDDEPSSEIGAGIQGVDDPDEENIFDDTKKPKIKHEAGSEETVETMSWTRTSGPGSAGNAICVSDSDSSSETDVGWPPTPSKRSKPTRTTVVKQEASQSNPSSSTNLRYDSVATPKQKASGTRPVPKIQIPAKPAATSNPEAKIVVATGGTAFNRELGEHVKDEPGALATPPQTPAKKFHNQARPPVSKSKGKQRPQAEDEHLYPSLVGLSTPLKPTPGRTGPSTSGRRAGTPKKEESDDDDFSIPGAWSTPRREGDKPGKTLSKSKLEEEGGERVGRETNPLPTPEPTPVRSNGRTAARGGGSKSKVEANPNVEEYLASPAPTPVSKKGKRGSAPLVPARPDHKDTPNEESPSVRPPKKKKEDLYFSLNMDFLPCLNPSSSAVVWVEIDGVNRFQIILPNREHLSWYQSLDAWTIFTGMAERYVKRLCGGRLKEQVEAGPQGFALCYAMGMGKTHVVVAVLYMLHTYMEEVAKVLGASAPPLKKHLIVAPVGVHQHWKDHITRITGDVITVELYNRTGKHSSGLSDSSAHVIITSPETLVNDRKRFKESRATVEKLVTDAVAHGNPKTPDDLRDMFTKQSDERSLPRDAPLGVTTWGVVIVDEFHDGCLANAENLASRAMLSLDADGFGLLSGTPAQNSVNWDLQAPLQLLSTHKSKRKGILLVEEECAKAGKKVGSKDVVRRLDVYSEESQALLQATFITRHIVNPVTGKQVIELPPKSVYYVHVELNDVERRACDTICDMVTCVLVKFIRGRLACDNTSVALKLMANTINRGQDFEGEPVQADSGNNEAPRSVVRHCPRPQNLPTNEDIWDAVAAATPEPDQFQDKVQDRILSGLARKAGVEECVLRDRFVSSKFAAVSIIAEQLPAGEKMIVFSMFTSVLDEVGNFLEEEGHDVVKYDGRMNPQARDTALQTISDDPSKRIILVSLKAGGVGLNITSCNHVILLDPWWNPYVEDQAIARAWRIGQTKEVHVYHLVCPETVEDRILEVQRKKKGEVEAFMEGLAMATHEGDHNTPIATVNLRM